MVLVSLTRCGRQDWMKHSPRRMAPLNWSLFGATKLHTLGGTHILCYTLGQCMRPGRRRRCCCCCVQYSTQLHRLQFHMALWSFTRSSCLMFPKSVRIQTSSTIGLMSWVRPSSTGYLIFTLVDWILSLWGGKRLTHLTVSVNDLQVSFGLRCLSWSGDFHARF